MKNYLIKILHTQNNHSYKKFRISWPEKYKHSYIENKIKLPGFKEMFFASDFFNNKISLTLYLYKAVHMYNKQSNKDTEYYRDKTEHFSTQMAPF